MRLRDWRHSARWRKAAVGTVFLLMPLPLLAKTQRSGPVNGPALPVCAHAATADVMSSLTADGEIALKAGGVARLAGIRLPQVGPFRDQALAWLGARIGDPVIVRGSDLRDRWGRRSVRLARAAGPEGSPDLARGLIEAGLAIADPGAEDALCPNDFLLREATARQRSLGIWTDAGYKPIGADQVDLLKGLTGAFVIVEGRVRNVGERAQWTYLNFGGRWAEDFTVVIPKKIWEQMTDRGMNAAALRGQQVRVRGILEAWQGASLTVEIPESIERLPR